MTAAEAHSVPAQLPQQYIEGNFSVVVLRAPLANCEPHCLTSLFCEMRRKQCLVHVELRMLSTAQVLRGRPSSSRMGLVACWCSGMHGIGMPSNARRRTKHVSSDQRALIFHWHIKKCKVAVKEGTADELDRACNAMSLCAGEQERACRKDK